MGIDLHRRRSVIVRMTEDGEVLECVRIMDDPVALSLELAKAGPDREVALEATYRWVLGCRPVAGGWHGGGRDHRLRNRARQGRGPRVEAVVRCPNGWR